MDDEVTLPQAALELRMSTDRTRRALMTGALKGRMFCGRWLITRTSIDAFKSERSNPPNTAAALQASAGA